jgi:NAD kinase
MKPIRKVLVVYYTKNYGMLPLVRQSIKKYGISADFSVRENGKSIKKYLKSKNAVIVVGGDGTLLRAAHFVVNTPVLHISSNTEINEGFFSRATNKDFDSKIKLIAKGKYKIIQLMRLEASINGKKLPFPALNEVYAGSEETYHTSMYLLMIGNNREAQKSSGIIISTPSGSHGWSKSAGGKAISITEKKICFVVREPYCGRLSSPKLTSGFVNSSQKIRIISEIRPLQRGIVVIDSYDQKFEFSNKDNLLVKASKQPLNLISF